LTLEGEQARSFGYGIIGSAFLQFRYENFSEPDQDGSSTFFMPGLRLYQRRVDDLIRPRKGFRYMLETRGSTQALGTESSFLQFLGNADLLIPLGAGFSLIPRTQLGATWQKDSLTDLPPSIRFYAGGDRSVRGYGYKEIGQYVEDASGERYVFGGKHLVVASVEYERMFTSEWGGAVFVDAGDAFDDIDAHAWQVGVGVGVRWRSPVGPVRVDIAHGLGDAAQSSLRLHFNIGPDL
jgi:translocation and assembly module TamA